MISFDSFPLKPEVLEALDDLKFQNCTPIQEAVLTRIFGKQKNMLALAPTGTGKTAAFGLPLIDRINPKLKAVQALVLCPTRELALQVSTQLKALSKHLNLGVVTLYGGVGYAEQIQNLKKKLPIVVATPGRLIDHVQEKRIDLSQIHTLVLDEADEMISMGFRDDIETIIQECEDEERLTWFFSATMNRALSDICKKYLKEYEKLDLNDKNQSPKNIKQEYFIVNEDKKNSLLLKLLEEDQNFYGLIFCHTKQKVEEVYELLKKKHYPVTYFHGDKNQREREMSLSTFKSKQNRILICTDVAARGIDVNNVNTVINFSPPHDPESYTHRIGRTGRMGKQGRSITFFYPSDRSLFEIITRHTNQPMEAGKLLSSAEKWEILSEKMLKEFEEVKVNEFLQKHFGSLWKKALKEYSNEEIGLRFLTLLLKEKHIDLHEEKSHSSLYHTEFQRREKSFSGSKRFGHSRKPRSFQKEEGRGRSSKSSFSAEGKKREFRGKRR